MNLDKVAEIVSEASVYSCYESDLEGTYDVLDLRDMYNAMISKEEYGDFEDWIFDMVRGGILVAEDMRTW